MNLIDQTLLSRITNIQGVPKELIKSKRLLQPQNCQEAKKFQMFKIHAQVNVLAYLHVLGMRFLVQCSIWDPVICLVNLLNSEE